MDESGSAISVGDTIRRQAPPEKQADGSGDQTTEPRGYNGDETEDYVIELLALTDQFITYGLQHEKRKLK